MSTVPACKEKYKNPGEAKAFPARASPRLRFPFWGLGLPQPAPGSALDGGAAPGGLGTCTLTFL